MVEISVKKFLYSQNIHSTFGNKRITVKNNNIKQLIYGS